jgi:hypothetical protein
MSKITSGPPPVYNELDSFRQAYFNLAHAVAEFSLEGRGQEESPKKKLRFKPFATDPDSYAAHIWDQSDEDARKIDREKLVSVVLTEVGKGKRLEDIALQEIGDTKKINVPLLKDLVAKYEYFISRLPDQMSEHKEDFLNISFHQHLERVGLYAINKNLIELVGHNQAENYFTTVIPPLPFAIAVAADSHAQEQLARFGGWWKGPFSRSIPLRYKKSSGLFWNTVEKVPLSIARNRQVLTPEDAVTYGTLWQIFKHSSSAYEEFRTCAYTLLKYTSLNKEEQANIISAIDRNADVINIAEIGSETAPTIIKKGSMGKKPAEKSTQETFNLRRDTYTIGVEAAAIAFMEDFDEISRRYEKLLGAITRSRVPVDDGDDERTEGLTVKYKGQFLALRRHFNSPELAGYLWHYADLHVDKAKDVVHSLIRNVVKTTGTTAPDRIGAIAEYLAPKKEAVPPNVTGRVYSLAATALVVLASRQIFKSLKHSSEKRGATQRALKICQCIATGNIIELYEQFSANSSVPLDAQGISIEIPKRPWYQPNLREEGKELPWGMRWWPYDVSEALSMLRPLHLDNDPTKMKKVLTDISYTYYPWDKKNIPTLYAIGALEGRLATRGKAEYDLAITFLKNAKDSAKSRIDDTPEALAYAMAAALDLSYLQTRRPGSQDDKEKYKGEAVNELLEAYALSQAPHHHWDQWSPEAKRLYNAAHIGYRVDDLVAWYASLHGATPHPMAEQSRNADHMLGNIEALIASNKTGLGEDNYLKSLKSRLLIARDGKFAPASLPGGRNPLVDNAQFRGQGLGAPDVKGLLK